MPPKLPLPHKRGFFFLAFFSSFKIAPAGEGNCAAIERQKLSRGNFCLERHQDASPGPVGYRGPFLEILCGFGPKVLEGPVYGGPDRNASKFSQSLSFSISLCLSFSLYVYAVGSITWPHLSRFRVNNLATYKSITWPPFWNPLFYCEFLECSIFRAVGANFVFGKVFFVKGVSENGRCTFFWGGGGKV